MRCAHEFDVNATCVPDAECNVKVETKFEKLFELSVVFAETINRIESKNQSENNGNFMEKKCSSSVSKKFISYHIKAILFYLIYYSRT